MPFTASPGDVKSAKVVLRDSCSNRTPRRSESRLPRSEPYWVSRSTGEVVADTREAAIAIAVGRKVEAELIREAEEFARRNKHPLPT